MFAAWLFGVIVGAAMIGVVIAAIATANPAIIAVAAIQAGLLVFAAYGFAYIISVMALAASVAATVVNFGTPNPLPANATELRARAFSVGLTAAINAVGAPIIASFVFPVVGTASGPL